MANYPFNLKQDAIRFLNFLGIFDVDGKKENIIGKIESTDDEEVFQTKLKSKFGGGIMKLTKINRWIGGWRVDYENVSLESPRENPRNIHTDLYKALAKNILDDVTELAIEIDRFNPHYMMGDHRMFKQGRESEKRIKASIKKMSASKLSKVKKMITSKGSEAVGYFNLG